MFITLFDFGLIFSWTNKNIAILILLLCCIYGLCQIHFFSYVFNQFKKTDFYDQHYVESEIISPDKKMNFIHIYLESMETTYAKKKMVAMQMKIYCLILPSLLKTLSLFRKTRKSEEPES